MTDSSTTIKPGTRFEVTAQAIVGTARISHIIHADSEAEVLRLVSPDLDRAGYYAVSIDRVP